VAGYSILNDVSARDLQLEVSQWTVGKAIDTFAQWDLVLFQRSWFRIRNSSIDHARNTARWSQRSSTSE